LTSAIYLFFSTVFELEIVCAPKEAKAPVSKLTVRLKSAFEKI